MLWFSNSVQTWKQRLVFEEHFVFRKISYDQNNGVSLSGPYCYFHGRWSYVLIRSLVEIRFLRIPKMFLWYIPLWMYGPIESILNNTWNGKNPLKECLNCIWIWASQFQDRYESDWSIDAEVNGSPLIDSVFYLYSSPNPHLFLFCFILFHFVLFLFCFFFS